MAISGGEERCPVPFPAARFVEIHAEVLKILFESNCVQLAANLIAYNKRNFFDWNIPRVEYEYGGV